MKPSRHAKRFSFPPTQNTDPLASATLKSHSPKRSQNQRLKLRASGERLLDLLSVEPLKRSEAL